MSGEWNNKSVRCISQIRIPDYWDDRSYKKIACPPRWESVGLCLDKLLIFFSCFPALSAGFLYMLWQLAGVLLFCFHVIMLWLICVCLQVDSDNTSERNRSVSDAGIAFPKLNTLDLSHNRLSDIPATISEHSKLTQLNLASNRLRDVSYSQYLMS